MVIVAQDIKKNITNTSKVPFSGIFDFKTLMSKMKAHLHLFLQKITMFFTNMASFYELKDIFNPHSRKIKYQTKLLIY